MPRLTLELFTREGGTKKFDFDFVKEGTMFGSEGMSSDDGGSFLSGAGADVDLPPPLTGPFSSVNLGN